MTQSGIHGFKKSERLGVPHTSTLLIKMCSPVARAETVTNQNSWLQRPGSLTNATPADRQNYAWESVFNNDINSRI